MNRICLFTFQVVILLLSLTGLSQGDNSNYSEYNCGPDCFVFEGKIGYEAIGNSMNYAEDNTNCNKKYSTNATLEIPEGATVKKAFLHWAGSRHQVDYNVTLNGQNVSAIKSYQHSTKIGQATNWLGWVLQEYFIHYYAAYADVTNLVTSSGTYTVSNLEWDNSGWVCDVNGAMGAWSLVVVYEDLNQQDECKIHVCQDEFRAQTDNLNTSYVNFNHTINCVDIDPNCTDQGEFCLIVYEGDSYKGETYYIGTMNNQYYTESGSGPAGPFKGQTAPNFDIIQIDISDFIGNYSNTSQFNHGWHASNVSTQFGTAKEQAFDFVKILKYNLNSVTADAGTDITIEEGETATLTATGGPNFLWSTGETTASIEVSPTETTTYTVTSSDPNKPGCTDSDEVTVTVIPCEDSNGNPCGTGVNIGDYVWFDDNQNGIQEDNEMPVEGVTVTLISPGPDGVFHSEDDQVVDSVITDENGEYLFTDVVPGEYCIQFNGTTLPSGYLFTNQDEGSDDELDSDVNNFGKTESFTVTDEDDLSFDAGIYTEVNVGNYVWFDDNENGIQDQNEAPVPGVSVRLISPGPDGLFHTDDDELEDIESTDENGMYLFENVLPGEYCIQFVTNTLPSGFTYTEANQGNDELDSDANSQGKTDSFTVLADQDDDLTWDAGIVSSLNIGNYVWFDENQDGIQDENEAPVEGVTVTLISPGPDGLFHTDDDVIVDTQVTDENGEYLFNNVEPGEYCIEFISSTLPEGAEFTQANQGGNDELDSDADEFGKTDPFTVTPGQDDDLSWDAGIIRPVNVGNYVWFDDNLNGIQDEDELPVQHIPVFLISPGPDGLFNTNDDIIEDTQSTNDEGLYLFENVLPGTYCIEFEISSLSSEFQFTTQNVGNNDTIDSDANADGKTEVFNVEAGQDDDLTWDAGIIRPVNIGDYVWFDDNQNGIQDEDELPVEGVLVSLITPGPDGIFHTDDDETEDTQVTDENGRYLFENVIPGEYCIQFNENSLPNGFDFTAQNQGNDDSADSDADEFGKTETFTVTPGQADDLDWDAGIFNSVNVGNYVWFDDNLDGIQDSNEEPVENVVVNLISAGPDGEFHTDDDITVDTEQTDQNGLYLFENVAPGEYCIEFELNSLPEDFEFTTQNEGGNDIIDSDADEFGKTETFTVLASQEDDLTWDAGIRIPTASLGNRVWEDENKNGTQDPGEDGVEGITVELFICGEDEPIATTTTDENGLYSFENLTPNQEYYVVFSDLPDNYIFTEQNQSNVEDDSNADENGETECILLPPGENNETIDAGIFSVTNVGDYVWFDDNQNGIQDEDELPVEGVTVTLISAGPDGEFHTDDDILEDIQVTDQNGEYLFEEVTPGEYCIQFDGSTLPNNYLFTDQNQGGNDELDSDVNNFGKTESFTVVSSQEDDLSWDAGIFDPVNVGDYVWFDDNLDGIQDPNEDPVENIIVNLISAGPDGEFHTDDDITVDTEQTNQNGLYLFENVAPGEYCIEFELSSIPEDFEFTAQNAGGNDMIDSDADEFGKTDAFTVLASQEDDLSWDAGIHVQTASLGNRVWEDENKDGTQDPGEEGVEGITVELYICGEDEPIASTTTDENGNYSFENLTPNEEYYVVFSDLPDNYIFTEQNQTNEEDDSNADENGETECVLLPPGENNETIDTGIYAVTNVGDYVWFDENVNGIQDPSEDPVEGVTVQLIGPGADGEFHTADDEIIDTQVTDENGFYLFENVDEGMYCIQFVNSTLPVDFVYTLQNESDSDENDSDPDQEGKTSIFNVEYAQEDDLTWDAGITPCTIPELIGEEPADVDYDCEDGLPEAADLEFIDVLDNNLDVNFEETSEEIDCNLVTTRVWTVTNFCGNSIEIEQVLTSFDNTSPILIGVPADETLECDESPSDAIVVAQDNCDEGPITISLDSSNESNACGSVMTRTWSAEDKCGNPVSVTQTITFVDTTAPSVTEEPENLTIECDEDIPVYIPEWVDNCDDDLVLELDSTITPTQCGSVIEYIWTAEDSCNNQSSVERTVEIVDTTNPVFTSVPEDVSVECDSVPDPEVLTATDNCTADVEITFNEESTGTSCDYTLMRTWIATDECGNETEHIQMIQVEDSTAPVLEGVPADMSVECDEIPDAAEPTATDNCSSDVEISFNEETTGDLDCSYTLIRTWTATDECGNSTSLTQNINVEDTTDPSVISSPEDVTVECDEDLPTDLPVFSDNCDTDLDITFSSDTTPLDCYEQIEKTWTAIDNCGNSVTTTQIITVVDTTNPVLEGVPEDLTLECTEEVDEPMVTATDNCSDDLDVILTVDTDSDGCNEIITKTWSVEDICGNQTMATQVITFIDTTDPELDEAPEDMTVPCDAIPEPAVLEATDNCDEDVEVTFSSETEGDACEYTLTRTWTAVDCSGNMDVSTQVITVVDDEDPVFEPFPIEVTVDCTEVSSYTIEVTDNCDEDVTLTFEDVFFSGGCYGVLQRTWTATDDCGNQSMALQFIRQEDSVLPELFNVPEDITLECGDEIPDVALDVFATDNCDDDVSLSFEETQTSEFCPYVITRIWTAEDGCGNQITGTQLITVEVETPSTVSISSSPNPTSGEFNLQFSTPTDENISACVMSPLGQEITPVFQGRADGNRLYSYQINPTDWQSGVYIFQLVTDHKVYYHKIVISNK